jgi:sulfonate transport system substrate-binding protein
MRRWMAGGFAAVLAVIGGVWTGPGKAADLDYGKPGTPVSLVVGYQPYYTEAWSGAVINGLSLWRKYLPAGSTVQFRAGLQGAIIVNQMLAGKASIGYLGDMPAIVGATKRNVADLRIVAAIGLGHDQCNMFLVRPDAPSFSTTQDAVRWLNGRVVAAPKGSCSDRFARAVFAKSSVTPSEYLNQSIEVITSGFRAGKLDGAVVWEPTASRLMTEGLVRRVASGSNFDEPDGAFVDMRNDLIRQRPDVVEGWLRAELDAERYLADPAHAADVVRMLKAQTTGFSEKELWQSLYGAYSAAQGGSAQRLVLPFAFTDVVNGLLSKDTSFLYSVKGINTPTLPADAVQPQFVTAVLKQQGVSAPVGEVKGQPASAFASSSK